MTKRILLLIFGAVLLLSAAPLASRAALPGTAQASTSKAKKKGRATKSSRKSKAKGQAAPTAERIKEIQSALHREGAYVGEPTGKWDETTADAMKKYQDKNGLNPTGKIDAVTLEKLGLGSGTAGKGAPVPAASTSPPAASASPAAAPTASDPSPKP